MTLRTVLSSQVRGSHAAFFHAALESPIAVTNDRAADASVDFVALALDTYLELGGKIGRERPFRRAVARRPGYVLLAQRQLGRSLPRNRPRE